MGYKLRLSAELLGCGDIPSLVSDTRIRRNLALGTSTAAKCMASIVLKTVPRGCLSVEKGSKIILPVKTRAQLKQYMLLVDDSYPIGICQGRQVGRGFRLQEGGEVLAFAWWKVTGVRKSNFRSSFAKLFGLSKTKTGI